MMGRRSGTDAFIHHSPLIIHHSKVVPAHSDHIYWLANKMRRADRDEVAAEGGRGPYAALRDSLASSAVAWTGLVNDEPVCMFGVSPIDILGGVGSPWLLGTDKIRKHSVTFLKLNRLYIPKMLDLFPHLVNYVDVRNALSIRWLRWLGFAVDDKAVPYGIRAMPFYRFEMWLSLDRQFPGRAPEKRNDHIMKKEVEECHCL